jgi:teichuronic acid biosynthesis protein TuaE
LSFLWAKDGRNVVIQSLNIVNAFITLFLVTQIITTPKKLKLIFSVLAIIYILYIITGLYEIFTWQHLPQSKAFREGFITFIPYGPFYNQNNFAAALLLLTPLVLFLIKNTNSLIVKIMLSICISITVIMFFLQGARIAIFVFFIMILIYFLFYLNKKVKLIFLITIVFCIYFLSVYYPIVTETIKYHVQKEYDSIIYETESYRTTSILSRIYLVSVTLEITYRSLFLGVGSGNFANYMDNYIIKTNEIRDAHNFLLEILASNGILIYLVLILLLFLTHVNILKIKNQFKEIKFLKEGLIFASFTLYFVFLLPSSMRDFFWHWIIISLIVAYININSKSENLDER